MSPPLALKQAALGGVYLLQCCSASGLRWNVQLTLCRWKTVQAALPKAWQDDHHCCAHRLVTLCCAALVQDTTRPAPSTARSSNIPSATILHSTADV